MHSTQELEKLMTAQQSLFRDPSCDEITLALFFERVECISSAYDLIERKVYHTTHPSQKDLQLQKLSTILQDVIHTHLYYARETAQIMQIYKHLGHYNSQTIKQAAKKAQDTITLLVNYLQRYDMQ